MKNKNVKGRLFALPMLALSVIMLSTLALVPSSTSALPFDTSTSVQLVTEQTSTSHIPTPPGLEKAKERAAFLGLQEPTLERKTDAQSCSVGIEPTLKVDRDKPGVGNAKQMACFDTAEDSDRFVQALSRRPEHAPKKVEPASGTLSIIPTASGAANTSMSACDPEGDKSLCFPTSSQQNRSLGWTCMDVPNYGTAQPLCDTQRYHWYATTSTAKCLYSRWPSYEYFTNRVLVNGTWKTLNFNLYKSVAFATGCYAEVAYRNSSMSGSPLSQVWNTRYTVDTFGDNRYKGSPGGKSDVMYSMTWGVS